MAKKKGKLFVISAPSGSGKTTLCEELIRRVPNIVRSISMTTRPRRREERDGKDYFFVTRKEFENDIKMKKFLEWERNFGHLYGTPKNRVIDLLAHGIDVILSIDVKGAMKIKRLRQESVLIFILPPSMAELKNRLAHRKTDDDLEISTRIRIARRELSYSPRYTYAVVNDNLKAATDKLEAIVLAERCRII